MRNDLLLKIADHVETVSPDSLVMNVWLARGGTIGCAIGHSASILPELEWKNCVLGQIPFFNEKPGIEGVAELLEIEFEEARCLFLRSYYTSITPQIIANRIRNFVKDRNIVNNISIKLLQIPNGEVFIQNERLKAIKQSKITYESKTNGI